MGHGFVFALIQSMFSLSDFSFSYQALTWPQFAGKWCSSLQKTQNAFPHLHSTHWMSAVGEISAR